MTENQEIQARQMGRRGGDRIVGTSSAIQQAIQRAMAGARSQAVVLVVGPRGSGKAHFARAIHDWSKASGGPFVVMPAGGTTQPIQERELFGVSRTSEPLLSGGYKGALERATGGSLVVENVDQLAGPVRVALIQAIKEGSFNRVGDSHVIGLRARIIATAQSSSGRALGDLPVQEVKLPPLSARSEDILPLAAHFLAECAADTGTTPVGFTGDARRWLVEEAWPGNVLELWERIRQAVRLAGNGAVSAEALMLATGGDAVPSFKEAKRAFETRYVEGLLRRCGGNISRAARLAKKDRKDFYDVIRRTSVDPTQFRP
jgi:two-component system response regulator GlrR